MRGPFTGLRRSKERGGEGGGLRDQGPGELATYHIVHCSAPGTARAAQHVDDVSEHAPDISTMGVRWSRVSECVTRLGSSVKISRDGA